VHVLPEHARPGPLQKFGARLLDESLQHDWPSPPHAPQPPGVVDAHVPSEPPQELPGAIHLPPTQQPAPPHVLFPQHGWFGPPHACRVPFAQTASGFDPDCPGATHFLVAASKHAPPVQVVAAGHAGAPATPQYSQSFLAKHPLSVPHVFPTSTHVE
jgi:hypothetical protein